MIARFSVSKFSAGLAAAALVAVAMPVPASAQFFWRSWNAPIYAPAPYGNTRLRAGDVHRMLIDEGYNVVGVYRNGNVFIADVETRRGRDRLIVDGQSGRIVQAYRNGGAYAGGGYVDEPAYERRRTARVVPPADIEERPSPGFEPLPSAKPYVAPRAAAPVQRVKPVKPREQAVLPRPARIPDVAPAPVKPAAVAPTQPPAAATPVPEVKPATPSQPPAQAVTPASPAPATDIGPVARPVQRGATRVNDIPVAPLDDAMPKRAPKTPVNDVPVAPLE